MKTHCRSQKNLFIFISENYFSLTDVNIILFVFFQFFKYIHQVIRLLNRNSLMTYKLESWLPTILSCNVLKMCTIKILPNHLSSAKSVRNLKLGKFYRFFLFSLVVSNKNIKIIYNFGLDFH